MTTSPITHEAARIIAEILGQDGILAVISRVSEMESVVSVREG